MAVWRHCGAAVHRGRLPPRPSGRHRGGEVTLEFPSPPRSNHPPAQGSDTAVDHEDLSDEELDDLLGRERADLPAWDEDAYDIHRR